jgi:hypothetical protein
VVVTHKASKTELSPQFGLSTVHADVLPFMANKIGVDWLVSSLPDAKPTDMYSVVGNLIRLEKSN